jgi:SNF2 family DNA or RNA helicase
MRKREAGLERDAGYIGQRSILSSHIVQRQGLILNRQDGPILVTLLTKVTCSSGGILADEMGLGKSLTTLALVAGTFAGSTSERREFGDGPTLVITPTSSQYPLVKYLC